MAEQTKLKLSMDGAVAVIAMSDAPSLNAASPDLAKSLDDVLSTLAADRASAPPRAP